MASLSTCHLGLRLGWQIFFNICALAECAICGQPYTTHNSLTGITGPDEETRKNTVSFLLPELSLIFTAIKPILKSYGLVVDVHAANERRLFFNSIRTLYD